MTLKKEVNGWKDAISNETKRRVSGIQKPNYKRFIIAILLGIIVLLADSYVSFKVGQYVTNSERYADIHASFGQLSKDNFGLFFPVILTNSGTLDLNNVDIKVKTCDMENFEQLPPIKFLSKEGGIQTERFSEKNTLSAIPQKLCDPQYNFSLKNCQIDTYIINSTNLYTPEKNCSIFFCDYCQYEIKIKSPELKNEKIDSGWFISTKEVKLSIKPEKTYPEINASNLKYFSSIGFNFFSGMELCLYDINCPFYEFSKNETGAKSSFYTYLLTEFMPLNLSMSITPNRTIYHYNNVTVFISFTKAQEQEIIENALNVSFNNTEFEKIERINGSRFLITYRRTK